MSFLAIAKQKLARSIGNFLWAEFQNSQGQSWLSNGVWGSSGTFINNSSVLGEADNKINPQLLVEVCRNQVIFAIKNTIRLRLKEKPYYFKGGKTTSKSLLKILKEADFERFVDTWLEAMLGTGGGNALCFVNRENKFICEPFNAEGRTRVRVMADYNAREITSYEVVNSTLTRLAEFEASYVFHERYAEEGDFRFAINPAVVATRYYMIERRAFGALETGFENIKRSKRFASPDLGFLKEISEFDRPNTMKIWLDFAQVLKDLPGWVASPLPMEIKNLTLTPAEMQTIDVLKYLDIVMGGAYSTSLSILGRSDGVNYANGEQNADNFYQLAVETIKARIEDITQRLMKQLLPDYDEVSNPFKFCKEINDEDIKQSDQILVTLKEVAPVVQSLGYKIKKESIANMLSKFGLELEDGEQNIVDVQANEDITQDDQEIEIEPKRFFQRAITKSQIKGVDDLANDKELQESKKKLFKAIESQIKEAKLSFDKRALESIKPIETYLNQDGFKKLTKIALKASLNIYNYNYGTNYKITDAPKHLIEYSELFAKITLYGWEGVEIKDYSQEAIDLVNIPRNYQGIDTTTKEQLNNKQEDYDQSAFIQNRQQTIWEGLESSIFHTTHDEFADNDGRDFEGFISSRDPRVRPIHRLFDNKYGRKGEIYDINKDYLCRCVKYRGKSEEEMINMGFVPYR